MRLIDADALVIDYYDDFETKDDIYTYAYVSEAQIDSAPSIDIVRCKECRYWGGCKNTMHNSHRCGRTENVDYWTRADDFCSYGDREGE